MEGIGSGFRLGSGGVRTIRGEIAEVKKGERSSCFKNNENSGRKANCQDWLKQLIKMRIMGTLPLTTHPSWYNPASDFLLGFLK
jgi:hypothetical protein